MQTISTTEKVKYVSTCTVSRNPYTTQHREPLTMKQIRRVCERWFGLPEGGSLARTRKKEVVAARHIAMYLSTLYTPHSLSDIGDEFGGQNHSTVIHARERVNDQLCLWYDNDIKDAVQAIEKQLMAENLN